jgi:release factor glutamine methyltransferase
VNVRAALSEGTGALGKSCPGSPFLDAALLLGFSMDLDKERLLASMPDEVPSDALAAYRSCLSRRASGEPVAYIVGYKEFYGRRFAVDRRVLIPRPDTELLVEVALSLLPPLEGRSGGKRSPFRCHDAFTGSGCVGVSIAAERPGLDVSLSDASRDALEVARLNARTLLGRDLEIRQGDVLSAAHGSFGLVTANPPYVCSRLVEGIASRGEGEPRAALEGGERGLDLYPAIAAQAMELLADAGALAVEIGEEQGGEVRSMLRSAGYINVTVHKDLACHDRVVSGVKHAVRR